MAFRPSDIAQFTTGKFAPKSTLDVNVTIEGREALGDNLQLVEEYILEAAGRISQKGAALVFAKSQEYVPYRSGQLYDAGYCRPAKWGNEGAPEHPVGLGSTGRTIGWGEAPDLGGGSPFVWHTTTRRTPTGGIYAAQERSWIVGYDVEKAPHAIVVHENPPQERWDGKSMEFQNSPPKRDHFLQVARDEVASVYPNIAREEVVHNVIRRTYRVPNPRMAPPSSMAPRLVRRK